MEGLPISRLFFASHGRWSDGGRAEFLIAYNVDLATSDVEIAREIATKIRESSGGFRFVKAMGLFLDSAKCSQVSMNLTNFAEIPLDDLYKTIQDEAARRGTSIAESELIGFVRRPRLSRLPSSFAARGIRGVADY